MTCRLGPSGPARPSCDALSVVAAVRGALTVAACADTEAADLGVVEAAESLTVAAMVKDVVPAAAGRRHPGEGVIGCYRMLAGLQGGGGNQGG